MRAYQRLLPATVAACLALSATPALAATTLDFETKGDGSATTTGAALGTDYASLGATFTDALYFQCGGGCPTPSNGHFVSGTGTASAFSVLFNGTTDSASFANVSFSSGSATSYALDGTLLETLNFSAYPATYSFVTAGIHSITFSPNGDYGIDNLSYGALTGVPEPGTWLLMLLGFGAIGMSMRRRKSTLAVA